MQSPDFAPNNDAIDRIIAFNRFIFGDEITIIDAMGPHPQPIESGATTEITADSTDKSAA